MTKRTTFQNLSCVVALVGAASSGCFWATTKSEGDALRNDIKSIQSRLETKERSLDTEIVQLQKVLDDATKLLKRNNADLGAEVEQLRADVRTVTGLSTSASAAINDLKQAFATYQKAADQRLEALEARIGQIESGKPTARSSPDELWRLSTQAFGAQRYNEAIEIFKRLTQTYPIDDRADDAVYFKGQSYGHLKDWDRAIAAYQQLFAKYANSSLADDGLYFAALAAKELRNCIEARTYLGLLKSKYPKSNVRKEAFALDAQIKNDAKKKSMCTS